MQLPLGVSRLASKRRYRQTGQRLSRKLLFDSRDMVFWATPSTIPEVSYLSPTTDAEISLSWAEPGSMLSRSRYFGESMHAAARLYQMDQCLYSTAGTTFNVQVSFQYLHGFNPRMKILLPDNLHLSAAASVQRYHLTPEFYRLGYDPEFETFVPISPEDMSHVLDKRDDVGAVLIVDPCYGGASGHLSRVIRAIREHDENIIVVVDAAWGSHFIHLKDGPRPASTCGADLVLHSLHKTGGGRQSTALLMWDEDRIDTATMMATYRDLATPSPNYPLLNNIANVVEYTYSKGRRSVANVVRKAERLRKLVSTEIPAARILDSKWALNRREHVAGVDPIATTIAYTQFKVIGYQIGRRLNGGGFVTEKDGLNSSLFMATFQLPKLAPDWTSAALEKILGKAFRADGKWLGQPHINHLVHRDLLATWTFPFAAFEEVPIERAIGRRLGENLVVYPPGVPIRIKGEILDSSTCSYLQHVHSVGGHIATADETFTTVKVLKEDRSIWSK